MSQIIEDTISPSAVGLPDAQDVFGIERYNLISEADEFDGPLLFECSFKLMTSGRVPNLD
jgi:hypothetical protein